ncbi:anthranilate phosphoribosyltransferase [Psychroflexus halocasei]|uniref:Anthranilate phosphoribosyltransferase n=1 Tax=Psychroflexus halocasei TaxID=908615 RepID=A0A1H3WJW2_9FLAO|nr:anthranilate phosphoribosyltransferase [Psychroflexus halocasei]SDZ87409.1 anthranilate phosphoribosyltransferase [Psychroflexus halocasei]
MKDLLNRLIQHETIDKDEAKSALLKISSQEINPLQIASFLTVFMMRKITIEELEGFKEALLETCHKIDLSAYDAMDLCGTGGDGKNTFNISTAASFVVASLGINVAKHGNYGVSSISGSSNVLESIGVKFTNDEKRLQNQMERTGICILHAPLFHPAMKAVASIRKSLAIKTFFNMLGPMVNPSQPKHQLVGVFDLELLRLYHYLYQKTDKNYCIINDLNGYDEISLTGKSRLISTSEDMYINPQDFSASQIKPQSIYGGKTVDEAVEIFIKVLKGKADEAQLNVVSANAAAAIKLKKDISYKEAFDLAKNQLKRAKAYQVLMNLKEETHAYS